MTKKTLYLMRHGQTLFNLLGKIQGSCDSPLTQTGIRQAEIARRYFDENEITFTKAFSSTQERASDTLEIITSMPYERVKGLKEWDFGLYEAEREHLNPSPPYGDFFIKFGGEGQQGVGERMTQTLQELMAREDTECVFCVSHGGAIWSFMLQWEATNRSEGTNQISNCAVLKCTVEDGIFYLEEIIAHDFSELEAEVLG